MSRSDRESVDSKVREPPAHLVPGAGRWFSPPKQRRSREGLERVLQAAREMIEEGGYDALNMDQVARRAGVGISAIYSRLGSKQGVFVAVQLMTLDEIDVERQVRFDSAAVSASASPWATATAAVHDLAEILRLHSKMLRALVVRADVDDEVLGNAVGVNAQLARSFASVILVHRGSIIQADPEMAADVCFRIVYDTLIRRVVRGPHFESPVSISWEDMVTQLHTVCCSYLFNEQGVHA